MYFATDISLYFDLKSYKLVSVVRANTVHVFQVLKVIYVISYKKRPHVLPCFLHLENRSKWWILPHRALGLSQYVVNVSNVKWCLWTKYALLVMPSIFLFIYLFFIFIYLFFFIFFIFFFFWGGVHSAIYSAKIILISSLKLINMYYVCHTWYTRQYLWRTGKEFKRT